MIKAYKNKFQSKLIIGSTGGLTPLATMISASTAMDNSGLVHNIGPVVEWLGLDTVKVDQLYILVNTRLHGR